MRDFETVTLRCNDNAEALVFTRHKFHNGDVDFEFSIEDSYCGGDFMGIKGRFKRAWRAFWAKPICYTGVYIEDPEQVWSFLEQCTNMATKV